MKKWVFVIVAIIIVALVGWYFTALFKKSSVPTPSNGSVFNGLSTTPSGIAGGNQLSLTLSDGTKVTVPDFTKADQPTWAGPTGYLVAGSPTGTFLITYIPPDPQGNREQVSISLEAEPLGGTRLAAETALRDTLKLSDTQLCQLNIDVRTILGLNAAYDGKLLGLSFCPGSVKLP